MDLNNFDVIISGWSGKMGLALRKLAPFYFSGKIYDYKSIEGISLNHPIWIDFSNQAVFPTIITQVGRLHCPLVMGTTGLKEEDWECLKDLSQQIPVFYDTNFSLGVHLLRKLVASMPQQISNFDVIFKLLFIYYYFLIVFILYIIKYYFKSAYFLSIFKITHIFIFILFL